MQAVYLQGDPLNLSYKHTETFTDETPEDELKYSCTLNDGSPLPSWITYTQTADEFQFTGTPGSEHANASYTVALFAEDLGENVVSFDF